MEFTEEELVVIDALTEQNADLWSHDLLSDVKRRIKAYCRERQGEQCCYCRRSTFGEFKMVIDIEHILPKSKYRNHIFNVDNLAASCKRCNMSVKKEDDSFFVGNQEDESTHFIAENYRLIHPNLDSYFEHLEYMVHIVNQKMMVKYIVNNQSGKGQFTYDYFRLKELEINSFHEAQGIITNEMNVNGLDVQIVKELENLLL